jgi:hypothetical protein
MVEKKEQNKNVSFCLIILVFFDVFALEEKSIEVY